MADLALRGHASGLRRGSTTATDSTAASIATVVAVTTAATTSTIATSPAPTTVPIDASLAEGFDIALLLFATPLAATNTMGSILLTVTSFARNVVKEGCSAIVGVVGGGASGAMGSRVTIHISLAVSAMRFRLRSGRPSSNGFLHQILLVEFGIRRLKVVVRLRDFDFLVLSAGAPTSAAGVLVGTTSRTRAVVRTHLIHATSDRIN